MRVARSFTLPCTLFRVVMRVHACVCMCVCVASQLFYAV